MILRSWCLLSRSLKWVSSWLSGSLLWRFREGPCAKFLCEDNGDTLLVEGGEGLLAILPKGKGLYLGNAGIAARFLTTVCPLVQTMILVLLLSLAMLAWSSAPLGLSLSRWGPMAAMLIEKPMGTYLWQPLLKVWRVIPSNSLLLFQPTSIFYPPLRSLCCKICDVRAYRGPSYLTALYWYDDRDEDIWCRFLEGLTLHLCPAQIWCSLPCRAVMLRLIYLVEFAFWPRYTISS